MNSKTKLASSRIKLNGVSVSISHAPAFEMPKIVNTMPRAINNTALRKLARETIKL